MARTIAVLKLLSEYDVKVEIGALDVGVHSSAQVDKCQQGQAQGIINGLTPQHSQRVQQFATPLRADWRALRNSS